MNNGTPAGGGPDPGVNTEELFIMGSLGMGTKELDGDEFEGGNLELLERELQNAPQLPVAEETTQKQINSRGKQDRINPLVNTTLSFLVCPFRESKSSLSNFPEFFHRSCGGGTSHGFAPALSRVFTSPPWWLEILKNVLLGLLLQLKRQALKKK